MQRLVDCQAEQERHHRQYQENSAKPVDRSTQPASQPWHLGDNESKRDQAEWQIHEEDPMPAELVGKQPADEWADDTCQAKHRAEQAHVAGAIGWSKEITRNRKSRRGQRG